MPTSESPAEANEPKGPAQTSSETAPETGSTVLEGPVSSERESPVPSTRGSRWVDYDTHELLEMISELEDERRWARLREGALWALLVHLVLLSLLTWIPKYVFNAPAVVDRSHILDQHKDFTYLDTPYLPKAAPKLAPIKPPTIDRKTLEEMRKTVPPPPAPEQKTQEPAPVKPQPTPIPPTPQSQSQIEAPRPAAVPARPNFAMGSANPADQLRDAMRGAARNSSTMNDLPAARLPLHPGASPGVQILSDTQGVDFSAWMRRMYVETMRTWDPLIPDEVNPPINKTGVVIIRFKVLPNGRLMEGGMVLVGRSGDTALDRAAWGALTGSSYPPLPRDFHGPYLELQGSFWYGMEPK